MGWFWDSWSSQPNPGSTVHSNAANAVNVGNAATIRLESSREFAVQTKSSNSPQSPSKSREDQAHEDLISFLQSLEDSYKKPIAKSNDKARGGEDNDDQYPDPGADPNAPELITPYHLYPARASCTILFDTAFHCASPYGQFLNVYRYGTFRQCGALWNDMMWCLRTNRGWMGEEDRTQRTLRHGWERERERLRERGGTSEEIWERRKWVARDAFSERWGEETARRAIPGESEHSKGGAT